MKHLILFLIINNFLFSTVIQTSKKKICSSPIKVKSLENSKENQIIVCREKASFDNGEENLKLFLKMKNLVLPLDIYEPEGNVANLILAFDRLAGNNKIEIIILVAWKQYIEKTAEGTLYQVYIYHLLKNEKIIKKINNLFDMEFQGIREGEKSKALFVTKKSINKRLNEITSLDDTKNRIIKGDIISSNILEELLFYHPLTPKTLTKYNNIAYYLQQAGANEEAAYLLKKILKKFPKRTVAYINLGDAYWALGKKSKARKAYTTYIEQMCAKGLQKKIPKKVLKRVRNKR